MFQTLKKWTATLTSMAMLLQFIPATAFAQTSSNLPPHHPWSTPQQLSGLNQTSSIKQAIIKSFPDGNGNLEILYQEEEGYENITNATDQYRRIMYRKFSNGQWGTPVKLKEYYYKMGTSTQDFSFNDFEAVKIGNSIHFFYAWQELNSQTGQIHYLQIENGNIQTSKQITNGATKAYHPQIVADSTGNIHLIWRAGYDFKTKTGTSLVHYATGIGNTWSTNSTIPNTTPNRWASYLDEQHWGYNFAINLENNTPIVIYYNDHKFHFVKKNTNGWTTPIDIKISHHQSKGTIREYKGWGDPGGSQSLIHIFPKGNNQYDIYYTDYTNGRTTDVKGLDYFKLDLSQATGNLITTDSQDLIGGKTDSYKFTPLTYAIHPIGNGGYHIFTTEENRELPTPRISFFHNVYYGSNLTSRERTISHDMDSNTKILKRFASTVIGNKLAIYSTFKIPPVTNGANSTFETLYSEANYSSIFNAKIKPLSPINNATDIEVNPQLQWTPNGINFTDYNVYFGTDKNNLSQVTSNQKFTTHPVYDLELNKTYYWQIKGNQNGGEIWSDIWQFTTTNEEESKILGIAIPGAKRYYKNNNNLSNDKLISSASTNNEAYEIKFDPFLHQGDQMQIVVGAQSKWWHILAKKPQVSVEILDVINPETSTESTNKIGDGIEIDAPWWKFWDKEQTFSYQIPTNTGIGFYRVQTIKDGTPEKTKNFYIGYNSKEWFNSDKENNFNKYVESDNSTYLVPYYSSDDKLSIAGYTLNHNNKTNDVIAKKALKTVDGETNPFNAAKTLMETVNNENSWTRDGICETPNTIACIDSPTFQCMDFANLLIDYYRAIGLPARVVSGMKLKTPATEALGIDYWNFHEWTEVYQNNNWDNVFDGSDSIRFGGNRNEYGNTEILGFNPEFPKTSGIYAPTLAANLNSGTISPSDSRLENLTKLYKPDYSAPSSLSLQSTGGQTTGITFDIQNPTSQTIQGKDDAGNTGDKFFIEIVPVKDNRPITSKIKAITSGINIAPSATQSFNESISLNTNEYDDIFITLNKYISATESIQLSISSLNNSTSTLGILNTSNNGAQTGGTYRTAQGTSGPVFLTESHTADPQKSYTTERIKISNQDKNNTFQYTYTIDTSGTTLTVPGHTNPTSITNPNIHYINLNNTSSNTQTTHLFTKTPSQLTHQNNQLTITWDFTLTPFANRELNVYQESKTSSDTAANLYSGLAQNIITNNDPITYIDLTHNQNFKTIEDVPVDVIIENAAPTAITKDLKFKITTPPRPGESPRELPKVMDTTKSLTIPAASKLTEKITYQNHGDIRENRYTAHADFAYSNSTSTFQIESAFDITINNTSNQVDENKTYTLDVTIKNKWAQPINNVDITLSGLGFDLNNTAKTINLAANQSQNLTWTITPEQYGSFTLQLEAKAAQGGNHFAFHGVQILGLPDLNTHFEATHETTPNNAIPVKLTLYNAGDYEAQNIPIEFEAHQNLIFSEQANQTISIPAHSTKTITWNIKSTTPGGYGYLIKIDQSGNNKQELPGALIVKNSGHKADLIIDNQGDNTYGSNGNGGSTTKSVSHKDTVTLDVKLENEGKDDTFNLFWYSPSESPTILTDDQGTEYTTQPAQITLAANTAKNLKLKISTKANNKNDIAFLDLKSTNDPTLKESVKATINRQGISVSPEKVQHDIYTQGESFNFPITITPDGFRGSLTIDYPQTNLTATTNTLNIQDDTQKTVTFDLKPGITTDINETIKFTANNKTLGEVNLNINFNIQKPTDITNLTATPDQTKKEIILAWNHQETTTAFGGANINTSALVAMSNTDFITKNQNQTKSLKTKKEKITDKLKQPHQKDNLIIKVKDNLTTKEQKEFDKFFNQKSQTLKRIAVQKINKSNNPELLKFNAPEIVINNKEVKNSKVFEIEISEPTTANLEAQLTKLEEETWIEYAEPNYIWQTTTLPNDPQINQQWSLHNSGQNNGIAGADIDAQKGWDLYNSASSSPATITVAVLDSGVDYNHPDLTANIWSNPNEIPNNQIDDDGNGYIDDTRGYDMSTCAKYDQTGYCTQTKNQDNNPMDQDGHGTHVAGIIAAVANNNQGIAGVARNTKIMPVKFINDGFGDTVNAIKAIEYATNNGAQIINASWGANNYSQALKDAITTAESKGILFVAAAGNGGNDQIGDDNDATPYFPSSYALNSIISVGATDHKDNIAAFSNFGRTSVDIFAPGTDIISTLPNNQYGSESGTSMSAPLVSGTAALLWSQNNQSSYYGIKQNILNNTEFLSPLQNKSVTEGRLNLHKSISANNTLKHFTAYRSTSPITDVNTATKLGTTQTTTFTDTTPQPNTPYYYAITAVNTLDQESQPVTIASPVSINIVSIKYDAEDPNPLDEIAAHAVIDDNGNNVYQSKNYQWIISSEFIPVDTNKRYNLSGKFKSNGTEGSRLYYGLVNYDKDKKVISAWDHHRRGNNGLITNISNTEITVQDPLVNWAYDNQYYAGQRTLGFYYDGDTTKQPDKVYYNFTSYISKDTNDGVYSEAIGNTIKLNAPLPSEITSKIIPGTTIVKNHLSGGTYQYSAAIGEIVPNQWTTYSGDISGEGFNENQKIFRTGTKYVQLLLLNNHAQSGNTTELVFDDLEFKEVERKAPSITLNSPSTTDDPADTSYQITWTDNDPDSNAQISLYYDTDNSGEDGVLIAENLNEDDPTNSFTWDTKLLPENSYYIYATIDDQTTKVTNYSTGTVKVAHTTPLSIKYDAEEPNPLDKIAAHAIINDNGNNRYQSKNYQFIYSSDFIPVDTNKRYNLSGKFKSNGTEGSRLYYGLATYDENQQLISAWDVTRRGNDGLITNFTNSEITVQDDLSGWAYDNQYYAGQRTLGFYYDGDTTKRPDKVYYNYTSYISKDANEGVYSEAKNKTIKLNNPLPTDIASKIIPGTTVVKNHSSGGTYVYTAAVHSLVPNQWTTYSGDITKEAFNGSQNQFRVGTKYVKLLLLNNYAQYGNTTELLFDDLELQEIERKVPSITINSPSTIDDPADTSYSITWTDNDPDSDAKITLYYDTNNTGNDGILIAENISEDDPTNSFTWDTKLIPENSYYLYATIDDGTTKVTAYSPGTIKVTHTAPLSIKFDAEDLNPLDEIPAHAVINDNGNNVYQSKNYQWLTNSEFIPVDPNKQYRLSGKFKSNGTEDSKLYYGIATYDENKNFISAWQHHRRGNDGLITNISNTEITVASDLNDWTTGSGTYAWQRTLGFYFDGDTTKKPDRVYFNYSSGSSQDLNDGVYSEATNKTIKLNNPLPSDITSQIIPGQTIVKNHLSGGTYQYSAAIGKVVPQQWTTYSGDITGEGFNENQKIFRAGTKYIKLLLLNNYVQYGDTTELLYDDLEFIEIPLPPPPPTP